MMEVTLLHKQMDGEIGNGWPTNLRTSVSEDLYP